MSDIHADWKARGWVPLECHVCGGHGLVAGYDGPDECRVCEGSGHLWRSAKGIIAQYPGGPFRGREAA